MTMVDGGTPGPFFAQIGVALGNLSDTLDRQNKLQAAAKRATTPRDFHPIGNAVVGAGGFPAGTALVDLGVCDQGDVWLLRQLTVARGDATILTTLAGRADVFVTPTPPSLSALSPIGWRTTTSTLPNTSNWTSRQIVIKAGEHLYVVITGGTASQEVFCEATVEAYQEAAFGAVFDL